ncbi:MAG: HAD-like domain-containing protein [Monoraphidium minutum]|nr:MAG: HAD-like domain-containing protein [Monoraphidium minutum]
MRVDVDALNENLRTHGALRLRHAMRPDEAFGIVLNFDGIVADMNAVRAAAWRALAAARDLPLAEGQLRHPELHAMPPEVAAVRMLRWADSLKDGRELAFEHAGLAARALSEQASPRPGVRAWLDALGKFGVPCALVSALDRGTVRAALARMALHDHFTAMVTAEDEFETLSQRLLSASLKLARPPNMCVAIESTPEGVTAAHNCSMKAIGVQGPYRAYQLQTADLTCGSLGELTVYNIRRLFANRGAEFMDVEKQADRQQWDSEKRRRSRKRLGIAVIE